MLNGQLFVGMRGGPVSHSGHATAPAQDDSPTLHPGVGTDYVALIGRDLGSWRVQLSYRSTGSDLILGGETSGIITANALGARAISLEIGRLLVMSTDGNTLHLLAGVTSERWSFPLFVDQARRRWSAMLAVEGGIPVLGRLTGIVRLETSLGTGIFTADELPEGFSTASARRTALHLGLRARLR
jgi:hypothetical protein